MKWKRPLALAGVVCIAALYLIALISAFSRRPDASSWLMAAIFSTVAVPVFIYAAQMVVKLLKGDSHHR